MRFLTLCAAAALAAACGRRLEPLASPNEALSVSLNAEDSLTYTVVYRGDTLLEPSAVRLNLLLHRAGQPDQPLALGPGTLRRVQDSVVDETYTLPWGEAREIHHVGKRRRLHLETDGMPWYLDLHVTDEGWGIRTGWPLWDGVDSVTVVSEQTDYRLVGNPTAFWIPGDWDITEHLVNETPLRAIDAPSKRQAASLSNTYIPYNAVNTPVTFRYEANDAQRADVHVAFHEAALINYPAQTLRLRSDATGNPAAGGFVTELVGRARDSAKATLVGAFHTPWRMGLVSDDAAGLLQANLLLNLNAPNALGDVSSYARPMKYMGIWWEMHLGKNSWDLASGKHGATTANAKKLIDFAAQNGFQGVLVEGWNTGWEHWIGFDDREGVFDFVTPYPDYDLAAVQRYAQSKGLTLIMHHETSSAPRTYEKQLDTAYMLMQSLGIPAVKTGYVGPLLPKGEWHYGQWMVNHYQKTVETAAKYGVALDIHEPVTGTGLRRTYPNLMSREGARGQEFNAWSSDGGNPPSHIPNLAFTRMLSGPMDYTPGIFNLSLEPYKQNHPLQTTLAQQLSLYVVMYSPLQMAADLPEHYAPNGQVHPAFAFVREVAVDWEVTRVLPSRVGDYVAVARQERVDYQRPRPVRGQQPSPNGTGQNNQKSQKSVDKSSNLSDNSSTSVRKANTSVRKARTTDNLSTNPNTTNNPASGRWFVGIANDETPRTYALDLSFLPTDGPKKYTMTLFEDPEPAVIKTVLRTSNPPIRIRTFEVTRDTVLSIPLLRGGGCAAILSPVLL
jgi:alpha-glucosidase